MSFSMFFILSVWISPIRSMIFVCCAEIFATSADKKSSDLLISSASSGWLAVFFGGILSSLLAWLQEGVSYSIGIKDVPYGFST